MDEGIAFAIGFHKAELDIELILGQWASASSLPAV